MRGTSTSMVVGIRVTGHVAAVSLTRALFTPPEPWWMAVLIALEHIPETGRIAVGAVEAHEVSYRLAPCAESGSGVQGARCVDLLATGVRQ
jgi:hypothetical protein